MALLPKLKYITHVVLSNNKHVCTTPLKTAVATYVKLAINGFPNTSLTTGQFPNIFRTAVKIPGHLPGFPDKWSRSYERIQAM